MLLLLTSIGNNFWEKRNRAIVNHASVGKENPQSLHVAGPCTSALQKSQTLTAMDAEDYVVDDCSHGTSGLQHCMAYE